MAIINSNSSQSVLRSYNKLETTPARTPNPTTLAERALPVASLDGEARPAEVGPVSVNSEKVSGSASNAPMSATQIVLAQLREQISETREQIIKMEAELAAAIVRAKGERSAEVDALRGQLSGLHGQLASLMGAYADVLKEQSQSQKGSLVSTQQ